MKIGYLGAGAWGRCLGKLLVEKGHRVKQWTETKPTKRCYARGIGAELTLTSDLHEALVDADIIVESVTSQGLRPVLKRVSTLEGIEAPIVLTSKGIEQDTGLLLPEVAIEVMGEDYRARIGAISGPSLAEEVNRKLPTSVVGSSYDEALMMQICDIFVTPYFRVYPNKDIAGVAFGGAMKNIIAIACAISDGGGFGANTKATIMARGLHEMRKLSIFKGCHPETLNGLSGMGDLCATCLSTSSRNYQFGRLLAEGNTPDQAKEKVGMVVEGVYTCVSARQLAHRYHVDVPITEAVYSIIYEGVDLKRNIDALLTRVVKREHL